MDYSEGIIADNIILLWSKIGNYTSTSFSQGIGRKQ
jgi:hypothetical protein